MRQIAVIAAVRCTRSDSTQSINSASRISYSNLYDKSLHFHAPTSRVPTYAGLGDVPTSRVYKFARARDRNVTRPYGVRFAREKLARENGFSGPTLIYTDEASKIGRSVHATYCAPQSCCWKKSKNVSNMAC